MTIPALTWNKTNLLKAACYALLLSLVFAPLGHPQAVYSAPIAQKVLQEAVANGEADFLVVFKDQAGQTLAQKRFSTMLEQGQVVMETLRASAGRSQQDLLSQLRQEGISAQPFWIVNLIALRGPASLIQSIAQRPEVDYIVSNSSFQAALEQPQAGPSLNSASAAVEWNLSWVHAPEVWAMGATGQGIVYANADTGVQWDHPALVNQYRGWDSTASIANHDYNWWDGVRTHIDGAPTSLCGTAATAPCDDHGHGTHTMGIGIGSDAGGTQIGMAPGAKWISCRNMEAGVGRPSTYLSCFQFFLAPTDLSGTNPDPSKRPDVVSNSYDCPASEQCIDLRVLQSAVASLRAAGIFMSVSAGNYGSGCSTVKTPPGIEPGVFTVGSTGYQTNTISYFSSRGPVQINGVTWLKPDLVAPGGSVFSSYKGDLYNTLSGTSMAAPMVAGAVALLWSARPDLRRDIAKTEAVLRLSAVHLPASFGSASLCGSDLADMVPNNTYGYGELDVLAAVNFYPFILYWPFVAN